jgi:hypothetical protein
MNLVATVLGVLIICLMVIFGGNHLVTILSGNLSSGQTQDLTALAFFFLAGIYIAWRLINARRLPPILYSNQSYLWCKE